jgi:hypothetical protein
MNARVAMLMLASLLTVSACGTSDDKAKAGEKPAEKAPTCSDKALRNANPAFCVDLPAGYEAGAPAKNLADAMEITVARKADDERFFISWGRFKTAEEAVKSIKARDPQQKIVEQGDLPGGGYFVKTLSNDATTSNKDFHAVHVVVRGAKSHVQCFGQNFKADFVADVLKTCKAMRVD